MVGAGGGGEISQRLQGNAGFGIITLGYPPELDGYTLLLKTTHTLVTGLRYQADIDWEAFSSLALCKNKERLVREKQVNS